MWCSFPAMLVNNSMKYFLVLVLCLASITSMGQQTNPMFYKEILLTHKPYTLQSITEEIQTQSGISFSYNADNINPGTKIKIKGDRITVAEVLALIKKQTGISYKIISQRHIIYTAGAGKKPAAFKPKKIKHHTQRTEQDAEEPLLINEPAIATRSFRTAKTTTFTDTATDATIVVVGDSGLVANYYFGGGGSGGGGGNDETEEEEMAAPIPERKWRRGTSKSYGSDNSGAGNKTLHYLGNNLLLSPGISVDEVYYCNPTLKFGMNFIYGIASYNIGGGQNTWRYGIGGSANIDEHWSMHFVITTGQSVSKAYSIPSSIDTSVAATPLTATSKLMRYGISTHYNFGGGLAIEGGLTFNSLKTNYTSNGNPVSLSDILPAGYDADKRYPGIKPPYTLGNSYTGSSTGNTKTWLGIQLTLLYQLRFSGE
ncbi:hypothetical protein F0919_04250 [Taibaiella lutea]|uniref:Secretin/TonB short N-terminal domain-containing protein n=1 Tax=Taibaiella lutea TaxID=2608001 RepID=A0A5M6CNU6_9BACT|nr:STN domain-containing protein [Taibaiella lutea]KAA5536891.1 hypothetical protein F0919_04250 [Taibaiella lutea]